MPCRLVGWMVVLSVIISKKGWKFHFHARIGALVETLIKQAYAQ